MSGSSSNGSSSSKHKNPRRSVWRKIHRRIHDDPQHMYRISKDNATELKYIENLAEGVSNIDMVSKEWRDIYGAMFDESMFFEVADCDLKSIEKDIKRTFSLFQRTYPLKFLSMTNSLSNNKFGANSHYKSLETILRATTHHRTYCQGINFLAANFLMNEETPRDSFVLLNYLLRQCYLEILFDSKCSSLMEYMKIFEKRLRLHNKTVYSHFKDNNFGTVCYAIEWFTTCFIVSNPGLLSACCIDLLLMGYNNILLRLGLAITDVIGKDVLLLNQEELQIEFKKLTRGVDVVNTLTRALTLKQTGKKDDVLKMMSLNIYFMNPINELTDTMFDPTLKYDEEIVTLTMIETMNNNTNPNSKRNKSATSSHKGERIDRLAKKALDKAMNKDAFFRRQFEREGRRNLRPVCFDASAGRYINSSTPVDTGGASSAKQPVVAMSTKWLSLGTSAEAAVASHDNDSDEGIDVSFAGDNNIYTHDSPPAATAATAAPSSSQKSKRNSDFNAIREILNLVLYPSGYDGGDERSTDTAAEEERKEKEKYLDKTMGVSMGGPSGEGLNVIVNRTRSNSYLDTRNRAKKNKNRAKKKASARPAPVTSRAGDVISIGDSRIATSFAYQGSAIDCRGVIESPPPSLAYSAWLGDANASNKYDISRY